MARLTALMLCALLGAAAPRTGAADTPLCPSVVIAGTGEISPGLSDTEKRLICGDPKLEPWRRIPPSQAEFHLRSFLQERGYHHPRFKRSRATLTVELGSPSFASGIELVGPEEFHGELRRKRGIAGRKLTPSLLSSIEQWATQRMQAAGYPCPEISTLADPDTGMIRLQIREGPRQRLTKIREEPVPGLMPGVLRRYDAFDLDGRDGRGDWLNADWLVVSANRAVLDTIVENLHHRVSCGPDEAIVREIPVVGPPRIVSLGFGISTEGVVTGRASWRNSRLGIKGSSFDVVGFASAIEQRIDAGVDWYHLPFPSRRFIRPEFRLRHQNEDPFETLDAKGLLSYGTSWDGRSWGWIGSLGPAYTGVRTFRGEGPPESHFFSLDARWRVRSHGFEFFASDPREGFHGNVFASFSDKNLLSTASVQRLTFRGLSLWNYRHYDPPLWILGLRSELGAVLTPARPGPGSLLPPSFLQYLGGSANLRGYGRQELPLDGFGALTSIYVGAELRIPAALPARFEPLVFYDIGFLGKEPLHIDPPVYSSPGLGLRWLSPFGTFRTTLARGLPADLGHWQFFLSFGEEF